MATVPHRQTETIDPDNPPSVTDQPLAGIELEALEHWKKFQPTLVRQLKAQGPTALETAIRKAYWAREYGIMLTLAKNPTLHRIQAEELFHDQLFPPPEPSTTPARDRQTTT